MGSQSLRREGEKLVLLWEQKEEGGSSMLWSRGGTATRIGGYKASLN